MIIINNNNDLSTLSNFYLQIILSLHKCGNQGRLSSLQHKGVNFKHLKAFVNKWQ